MARIPKRGLDLGLLVEIMICLPFIVWLLLKYTKLWGYLTKKSSIDIDFLFFPSIVLVVVVLYFLFKSLRNRAEKRMDLKNKKKIEEMRTKQTLITKETLATILKLNYYPERSEKECRTLAEVFLADDFARSQVRTYREAFELLDLLQTRGFIKKEADE